MIAVFQSPLDQGKKVALAWAKAIGATRAGVIETTFREETESLNWRDSRLAEIPLIHLSDGSASTGIACTEAEAGLLRRYPHGGGRPAVPAGPD